VPVNDMVELTYEQRMGKGRRNAVEQGSKSLRHLRVAEISNSTCSWRHAKASYHSNMRAPEPKSQRRGEVFQLHSFTPNNDAAELTLRKRRRPSA
jgi:hypothetical protein